MRTRPTYSTLLSHYPRTTEKPARVLLDEIGGEVRRTLSDAINTCAIRMSFALNKSGARIRKFGGVRMLRGAGPSTTASRSTEEGSLFVIRAKEMKAYLDHAFGVGRLVYDGRRQLTPTFPAHHSQGIVAFDWLGPWAGFQAGGHIDLLRLTSDANGNAGQFLPSCEGHCYFLPDLGPMRAYFWELRP